jgi:hypothetical protein
MFRLQILYPSSKIHFDIMRHVPRLTITLKKYQRTYCRRSCLAWLSSTIFIFHMPKGFSSNGRSE